MPIRYITNADAHGAAARIQGYVALDGLGITRKRNQNRDKIPTTKNIIFEGMRNVLKKFTIALNRLLLLSLLIFGTS